MKGFGQGGRAKGWDLNMPLPTTGSACWVESQGVPRFRGVTCWIPRESSRLVFRRDSILDGAVFPALSDPGKLAAEV